MLVHEMVERKLNDVLEWLGSGNMQGETKLSEIVERLRKEITETLRYIQAQKNRSEGETELKKARNLK